MVSNAELDRLIIELGRHALAEAELRQVKEAVFVSLNQSQPEGVEYASSQFGRTNALKTFAATASPHQDQKLTLGWPAGEGRFCYSPTRRKTSSKRSKGVMSLGCALFTLPGQLFKVIGKVTPTLFIPRAADS